MDRVPDPWVFDFDEVCGEEVCPFVPVASTRESGCFLRGSSELFTDRGLPRAVMSSGLVFTEVVFGAADFGPDDVKFGEEVEGEAVGWN